MRTAQVGKKRWGFGLGFNVRRMKRDKKGELVMSEPRAKINKGDKN